MNESNPDYLCAVVVRVCLMRFNQIPAVRVHAVKALELLQSEESVQMELAKLLEGDPNADVRKTVLSVIVVIRAPFLVSISEAGTWRMRRVEHHLTKAVFWNIFGYNAPCESRNHSRPSPVVEKREC